MAIKKISRILALLFTILLVFFATAVPALSQNFPPPDPVFGLIEAHDAPAAAADLGVGWSRAKFHWGLIQPGGPDDWQTPDLDAAELAEELSAGREVIGLIVGIPEWAHDDAGLPAGLNLTFDDPANRWGVFVHELMTRYQGQITHWIIWNEPDIWDPSHPAHTWPGTEADFVALLKTAYLTAKSIDPAIQIHLPAMTHWWDIQYDRDLYFNRLLNAITADPDAVANDYYYDVATMHVYFNAASPYELIEQYRQIQSAHGIDKPFWLVETNAAPTNDPLRPVTDITFTLSLVEQASYIPQALAAALAAGAERIGVYKAIDTPGDWQANPEPFGLIREDGSRRPAYLTTRWAITELSGAQSVLWRDQGMVSQMIIRHEDHLTRMIWSRVSSPLSVEMPLLSATTTLTDMWGNELALNDENTLTLTLSAGECQETVSTFCMIGGPVFYISDSIPSEGVSDADLWIDADMIDQIDPAPTPSGLPAWFSWAAALMLILYLAFTGGGMLAKRFNEVKNG